MATKLPRWEVSIGGLAECVFALTSSNAIRSVAVKRYGEDQVVFARGSFDKAGFFFIVTTESDRYFVKASNEKQAFAILARRSSFSIKQVEEITVVATELATQASKPPRTQSCCDAPLQCIHCGCEIHGQKECPLCGEEVNYSALIK